MALTKAQKQDVVDEVSNLLKESKLTVALNYSGTGVKPLQELRRNGKENSTTIKIIKNRLVIKALKNNDTYKDIDTKLLNGQLLYAFNNQDEVAPAQVLAKFAKTYPNVKFIGAITNEGKFLTENEVKVLADLPNKNELIAQVIATLNSPVNDLTNSLSGNLHSLLDGISKKASV